MTCPQILWQPFSCTKIHWIFVSMSRNNRLNLMFHKLAWDCCVPTFFPSCISSPSLVQLSNKGKWCQNINATQKRKQHMIGIFPSWSFGTESPLPARFFPGNSPRSDTPNLSWYKILYLRCCQLSLVFCHTSPDIWPAFLTSYLFSFF